MAHQCGEALTCWPERTPTPDVSNRHLLRDQSDTSDLRGLTMIHYDPEANGHKFRTLFMDIFGDLNLWDLAKCLFWGLTVGILIDMYREGVSIEWFKW